MRILAIETSCDETAIALLEIEGELSKPIIKVLGNTLLSQATLHEQYGGVYPSLAKREHLKNLPILLEQTLEQAATALSLPRRGLGEVIDFIAVTSGPGLEPALWTGITFAEELGKKWGKPVVPVNHMEGHIYSILMQDEFSISNSQFSKLELPALALLVSGGHTELVHIRDFGHYEIIGRTLDDAVGEAFDKVARMLGLPYPGGPQISRLAEIHRTSGREDVIELPRPMLHSKDQNFSFSGLKTSVLYKIKAIGELTHDYKEAMARAFEDSVVEVLVSKTRQALDKLPDTKTLIVAGGVSANTYLVKNFQAMIKDFPEVALKFPIPSLSTDNATMIGIAGFVRVAQDPTLLEHKNVLIAKGNLSLDTN